jgi:hypothetical protein
MAGWQALRDMYDDIEVPLALVRFARELMHEVLDEIPMPQDVKLALYNEIRARVEERIKGHDYVLANYLIVLMARLPAADPYQHVEEE